jgi:hypothetical protein
VQEVRGYPYKLLRHESKELIGRKPAQLAKEVLGGLNTTHQNHAIGATISAISTSRSQRVL